MQVSPAQYAEIFNGASRWITIRGVRHPKTNDGEEVSGGDNVVISVTDRPGFNIRLRVAHVSVSAHSVYDLVCIKSEDFTPKDYCRWVVADSCTGERVLAQRKEHQDNIKSWVSATTVRTSDKGSDSD